jgi:hypothetical protein
MAQKLFHPLHVAIHGLHLLWGICNPRMDHDNLATFGPLGVTPAGLQIHDRFGQRKQDAERVTREAKFSEFPGVRPAAMKGYYGEGNAGDTE